ncbi:MAG: hypothetical protein O9338_01905, partial [Microcystis sp. LE19-251.1A]|nr:hypothetical protein [Microcystis sp. LE19-251.1A]
MKSKIIFLLSIITLLSCDDRLDFIADVNKSPVISVLKDGEVLTDFNIDHKLLDEIKGPGEEYYPITLLIDDAEGFDGIVTTSLVSGIGRVLTEDRQEIQGGVQFSNGTALTLLFDALGTNGVTRIRITATDNLEKSTSVELVITSFKNRLPVAEWNFRVLGINDPYEYELDASASIDEDASLGGGVVEYEWNINGNTFIVKTPKIPYVLSKASANGTTYSVKLRVKDNNGAFSANIEEKLITVN